MILLPPHESFKLAFNVHVSTGKPIDQAAAEIPLPFWTSDAQRAKAVEQNSIYFLRLVRPDGDGALVLAAAEFNHLECAAELRSPRPAAAPGGSWHTIAEAPRDGADLLLCDEGGVFIGRWLGPSSSGFWSTGREGDAAPPRRHPTIWMRVPVPAGMPNSRSPAASTT